MTKWQVKDLSRLTHVSVQTLHHYDRIGLLKPSARQPNGYRWYSEKDLLKLQQIIALKYFGFELSQIKKLLVAEIDLIDHFNVQKKLLEQKANTMLEASKALNRITSECNKNKSIHWETIIELIEVYRMTQELEKSWAGKALNPEELKEYANFERELQTRFSPSEQKACENAWADLVKEIDAHLDNDPASKIGIDIGRRVMQWVNNLYGKKHVSLRTTIWEKGFMKGHGSEEHGLSSKSVTWLDKAIDAYWRDRIYTTLNKVGKGSNAEVGKLWEEILTDMYGDQQGPKDELIKVALQDAKISDAAKKWLKS